MEPFRVHILGCGCALPTMRHNASSQVVEVREKQFMVDCGEGTQVQLRRSKIRFTRLNLLGRTAPLAVYGPAELQPILENLIGMFCASMDYEVVFHPVDTTKHQVIYEDRSLTVESIPL